ncbi:hypothetical protein N1027_11850 [Herbiconiux sp. CPCC 205763]|uniref:Uncharacterized protein n=1 Tax=Herbiconiux aconitum TaxID=2970913 RepID=A0ABT2GRH7_9MICO|nr:hypothetical protein [Herbiconiux aconitum]MCS5718828.1 hypothetical protein [Herbiconiux aconitum]
MPNYVTLPALQHFVLEESWVASIEVRSGIVELDVDLAYAADHPELRPPREGEYAYFRRGAIRFTGVSSVAWKDMEGPATDAAGVKDWGHIDTFDWIGTTFELEGDFGAIEIEANALDVILTGPE